MTMPAYFKARDVNGKIYDHVIALTRLFILQLVLDDAGNAIPLASGGYQVQRIRGTFVHVT